jgi:hypothetical protein
MSASMTNAVTHEQDHAYGFERVEAAIKMVSGEPTLGSNPPGNMLAAAHERRVFRASDPQRTLSH